MKNLLKAQPPLDTSAGGALEKFLILIVLVCIVMGFAGSAFAIDHDISTISNLRQWVVAG